MAAHGRLKVFIQLLLLIVCRLQDTRVSRDHRADSSDTTIFKHTRVVSVGVSRVWMNLDHPTALHLCLLKHHVMRGHVGAIFWKAFQLKESPIVSHVLHG
jgi:hypothetical protein